MATLKRKTSKPVEAAPAGPSITFELDGTKYKVLRGVVIPGGGTRVTVTAADIATDTEIQKYLVENQCSCIEKVVE